MSQDLVIENQQLRNQLTQLLRQAEQNQQILKRFQSFDLQFIGAASFRELADTIFYSFTAASELDTVTLLLLDPEYDIRRILSNMNIDLAELPHLLFMQEESKLNELLSHLHKPMLGPYSERLHDAMFPAPIPAPASTAIVPLMRQNRLIGCLSMGSRDPGRFAQGMGTEFIEHMGAIVAICLENVLNNERLKHIGLTDPLTGVNNRRYVERRLQEEIGRSRRHGYALSCMYIDIDHFKQINDRIGHQAGDEVLRAVAGRIKAELRLSDALGRFGGEEFVVLLIDTALPAAAGVAERIRYNIAERPLVLSNGEHVNVTISIGIASLTHVWENEPVESIAQKFVARADQALYRAKRDGRNRVVPDAA